MKHLPFLTLPDPVTAGEGALDPLGLSTTSERLADQVLPGLRARMSRPRFLTAVAVSAAVCEGLEDRIASDNVTPAYIVFEWLLVEGFVRASEKEHTKGTPGTLKAQAVKESGEPMCAKAYLRMPNIFGFDGVYKPLARHLGIVDDDLRLSDNGYPKQIVRSGCYTDWGMAEMLAEPRLQICLVCCAHRRSFCCN